MLDCCHFSVKSFTNLIIDFKLFSTKGIVEMLYFFKILDNVLKLSFEKEKQIFCWYFCGQKELFLILELLEE